MTEAEQSLQAKVVNIVTNTINGVMTKYLQKESFNTFYTNQVLPKIEILIKRVDELENKLNKQENKKITKEK